MKKRAMTLLEMMVVIFLIGTVLSVVGYNVKSSMDKGRAFKTEQAVSQIRDVLELESANGNIPRELTEEEIQRVLSDSGIVQNPQKIVKDGWGNPFVFDQDDEGNLLIASSKYTSFTGKELNEEVEEE